MLQDRPPWQAFGPYNLVYAGLFDYLSDRLVERMLAIIWGSLLAPGGRLVFTNIGTDNPFRVWLEYIASRRLTERSEADLIRLCQAAEIDAHVQLTRDATGLATWRA